MKKISFKDVKNALKRDEMRVIFGGSGGTGGQIGCGYFNGGHLYGNRCASDCTSTTNCPAQTGKSYSYCATYQCYPEPGVSTATVTTSKCNY